MTTPDHMARLFTPQLRWFLSQLKPLLWRHMLSILMIVVASLTFLLDPLIIKWLIDVVLPARDTRLLIFAATGIAGIYSIELGCSTIGGVLSFRTTQNLVYSIRLALLRQVNLLSADFHETVPLGEKLYRLEQDVDQVAELGSTLVPSVLQTTFTCIFVMSTMFLLNFRLTCVLLPLMPLFVAIRKHYQDRLRRAADSAQEKSSNETSFLQEHLASTIQIQMLNQEEQQTQAFVTRARARMKALDHRNLQEIFFRTWYVAIISLGSIAILSYGGYQVFSGALTVGGFIAFYSYVGRLFAPMSAAVDIYSRLNRLNSSMSRIHSIVEDKPTVCESRTAVQLPRELRNTIALEGVSFRYRDSPNVLTDLSLNIRAGEKVALLGISGSGKSTIAKLIARLYDVNQGAVHIGGIDLRDATLKSLRAAVCYVPQEPLLFDRSIRENLLLGNPDASPEELHMAVEIAGLTNILSCSPSGWDMRVGPRGNNLSGGQRQRVALARAVLRKPSIFLLDESTSALDIPSERHIYVNLTRRFASQTIVVISHRVSALTWVDRIVVLNQGVIEEQGSHDQLMRRGGLYTKLYQTGPQSDGSAPLRIPV
jgi:ABC-type bacteriocin/lantibiotic exporter with double-glycine peptidase domain